MFEMGEIIKNLTEFGANVHRLRKKYYPNISFSMAVARSGVSYMQLKKIEAGEMNPQLLTIMRLSECWNIPLIEFFEKEDLAEPAKKKKVVRAGG
jgi:predicted transcriptional regulator